MSGVHGPAAETPASGPGGEPVRLVLAHLYPDLLNIYGDRGNVLALVRRAEWRGVAVAVRAVGVGDAFAAADADIVCIGGGEDTKQAAAATDLARRGEELRRAVEGGLPVLAVCGGYQLLGHWYQPAGKPRLPGAGVLDVHTIAGPDRLVGNVVADSPWGTLVGFENHSGRTFLGPGCTPLARVRRGAGGGNNGADGSEGAVWHHCLGTYLHGSLLPKNPQLADLLLRAALARRYGEEVAAHVMRTLDDRAEWAAHRAAVALGGRRGRR
jgi:CobQ-like glutamine amidotransferase family enzyme